MLLLKCKVFVVLVSFANISCLRHMHLNIFIISDMFFSGINFYFYFILISDFYCCISTIFQTIIVKVLKNMLIYIVYISIVKGYIIQNFELTLNLLRRLTGHHQHWSCKRFCKSYFNAVHIQFINTLYCVGMLYYIYLLLSMFLNIEYFFFSTLKNNI